MIVIYETNTGEAKVMTAPRQPIDSIKDFVENTLHASLQYVFDEKDSLSFSAGEESFFKSHCYAYNLKPDDFHKEYYNPKGHKIRIEGLLPNNRKYKIKIYDFMDEKFYKVHQNYISQCQAI